MLSLSRVTDLKLDTTPLDLTSKHEDRETIFPFNQATLTNRGGPAFLQTLCKQIIWHFVIVYVNEPR